MGNDGGAAPKPDKRRRYHKGSVTVGKKPDGTPDRRYVYGKTKKERDAKVAELRRQRGRGLQLGGTTVREWSETWMAAYKANATENQKAHYAAKLKHDILPAVGNMRVADVRASHLQELLNAYAGGKKGTVEKIRNAIRQLFSDAAYEGVIERNPAERLELPELEEDARRPLTCMEREVALSVAGAHRSGPYVLAMYYLGIRRGECIALTRRDVDLEARRAIIDKSVEFKGNVGGESSTKAAKLRKRRARDDEALGARVVPIPGAFVPALSAACEGKGPDDLLFPKADGKLATKQACAWRWKSFARQCHIASGARLYRNAVVQGTSSFGQDVTPHYLRHTYATDLYAAGVDEKARQEFLGHALRDVTDAYTKMTGAAFDRAAGLIDLYHENRLWCCCDQVKRLRKKIGETK